MPGSDLVLDTSAAIHLINGVIPLSTLASYGRVCLPVAAIGELIFGAIKSSRVAENEPKFRGFIANCVALSAGEVTADFYARVRLQLRAAGTPIPDPDIWIAATCLEHRLPLATRDRHFQYVEGLQIAPV
jgi:tRNA(fMet)-specific endonuclease VapC